MAKKVSRVLLVVSIKLSFAVSQTIKKKTNILNSHLNLHQVSKGRIYPREVII